MIDDEYTRHIETDLTDPVMTHLIQNMLIWLKSKNVLS
jgi:hypothetical protein